MKDAVKRNWALGLMLLIVSAVCLLFSCRKSGMFIDEIYTYGLSNSYYAPYITDIKGGSALGQTYTREELFDYVAVTEGEAFSYGSVTYDQAADVHPPLYYWLFHTVCSFFPDTFTKWTGLGLDYVIYMLTLICLYRLLLGLFSSRTLAAAGVVLYGLSLLGMSTMLMIRMYVLLTALTLALALVVERLMRGFRPYLCVLAGLIILAGLLTQYYFVFYAFFLCGAYVLYALVKRDWRALKCFVPLALGGALCLLLVFPQCIDQLTADKLVSGGNALDNLKDPSQYLPRILYYIAQARHGLKAAIYVTLLALVLMAVFFKRLRAGLSSPAVVRALVLMVPAGVTFLLVAIIGPVTDERYIYNITPILILLPCTLLYLLLPLAEDKESRKALALLAVAALALWEARSAPPSYLYPEYVGYDKAVAELGSSPCVYITDDYFAPMTQDLIQLLAFDTVYVTNDRGLSSVKDYVAGAERFVVYIDISEYWSSGYHPEEILPLLLEETGYGDASQLYQNGLSSTYVISK